MPDDDLSRAELLRRFESSVSGLELADLRQLAGRYLGPADEQPLEPARPDLRRPPLPYARLLRIRVDLDQAEPPIWRTLDVRSDITLDLLHQVLQAAYGWQDSHLHRFSLNGGAFDLGSQLFLCPFDVEEQEDDGLPASAVRVDEVLQEAGDVLRYAYDYGDCWELILRVEDVLPAAADSPVAVCVGGQRAAPPEDCGSRRTAAELAEVVEDPAHFDVAEVNQALQDPYVVLRDAGLLPALVDLVTRLRFSSVRDDVVTRVLALCAARDEPADEDKRAALRAHLWFLERASQGGLPLTPAGYLRPADVEAASAVVPAVGGYPGKLNRESHVAPLLLFRESLQRLGLLRKRKGLLLTTRAGTAAHEDLSVLWNALADGLVPAEDDGAATDAGLLFLLHAATGDHVDRGLVAEALNELSWRYDGGERLDHLDAMHLALEQTRMLGNVTAEPRGTRDHDAVSPVASALARAALRAR